MSAHALVVNGQTPVGAAIVRELTAQGLTTSFTVPALGDEAQLVADTGSEAIVASVEDRQACDAALAKVAARGGSLERLVFVPDLGALPGATPLADGPLRDAVAALATPAFRYSRRAFGMMKQQGAGSITLVGGTAGLRGESDFPAVSTALSMIPPLARLLAAEGRSHGVVATALCVDWRCLGEDQAVDPAAVAGLVAWLGSPHASVASGAVLTADAGRTCAVGQPTTRSSTPDRDETATA